MDFRHKRRTAGAASPASQPMEEETSLQKHPLPNSMVMRIMQDKAAEQEADQLSRGVSSSTQDALREEMGGKPGANFSSVRFHNDSVSTAFFHRAGHYRHYSVFFILPSHQLTCPQALHEVRTINPGLSVK